MNDATDDTTSPQNDNSPAAPPANEQASDVVATPEGDARPVGASVSPAASPATGAQEGADARPDAERFKEQWMRTAADFDNFRKRSRREVEDARKSGREDLLRELLPVFDNLERGIQSAQRATDVKAVADGLGMILKQFLETLARAGITKIAGIGSAFDPSVHEAIQQVEAKDHPPGTVIAEVQPGYAQGERLIRAALVVVSKAPSDDGGGSAN